MTSFILSAPPILMLGERFLLIFKISYAGFRKYCLRVLHRSMLDGQYDALRHNARITPEDVIVFEYHIVQRSLKARHYGKRGTALTVPPSPMDKESMRKRSGDAPGRQ